MLTKGYYEAGQEQVELAMVNPALISFGAALPSQTMQVSKALYEIQQSGADIPMFTERCAEGNVLACQALMNRARQLGEECPADQVGALYPGVLQCDCATGKCVPQDTGEKMASAPGGVPMWAWLLGAGAIGLYVWRMR